MFGPEFQLTPQSTVHHFAGAAINFPLTNKTGDSFTRNSIFIFDAILIVAKKNTSILESAEALKQFSATCRTLSLFDIHEKGSFLSLVRRSFYYGDNRIKSSSVHQKHFSQVQVLNIRLLGMFEDKPRKKWAGSFIAVGRDKSKVIKEPF